MESLHLPEHQEVFGQERSSNPVWVQPDMDFFCIIGLGWISVGVEAIFKNLNLCESSILYG